MSKADERRHASVYEQEGEIPAKLIEDLRRAPRVPEEQINRLVEHHIVGLDHDRRGQLAHRELAVVLLLSFGFTYAGIAAMLVLAVVTVERHAKAAMYSLGARNKTHLVTLAWRQGLIE